MNMIPRSAPGHSAVEQSNDILLIAGSTPASGWERLLPLFERAGCTLPAPGVLDDWYTVARSNAALGQPGVARLNPGALHQSLRSSSSALLDVCLPPVLVSVEKIEARPEFWLEGLPGARLLMFHTRPEAALIVAMEQEEPLDEALAQWIESAEDLLHTYRHHRKRAVMIDVECAFTAPIEFLRCCKTWLGLHPLPFSAQPMSLPRDGSDIQYLIAAQMVVQSPRVSQLILDLEACSLPIGEPSSAPYVDCLKVYATQAGSGELKDVRTSEALLAVAMEERDALAIQLAQVLEKLQERDAQAREISEFNAREKALDDDIQLRMKLLHECEAKLKAAEKARRDVGQENELLALQLHQAQEELESYYLSLQSASAKAMETEKKLESLEKKLKNMKNSRSWKITAPLRKVMKAFPRKSKS